MNFEAFALFGAEEEAEYQQKVQEDIDEEYGKEFNKVVKTGYGVTRVLRKLVELSRGSRDGKPYILRYYNRFSGSQYVVVVTGLSITMNESKNYIWDYSLELKAIAYAGDERYSTLTSTANFQQTLLRVAVDILDRTGENILNNVIF